MIQIAVHGTRHAPFRVGVCVLPASFWCRHQRTKQHNPWAITLPISARAASPAADGPRDVGGLGSSELIARLGGWHLEGPGRADLMPGINRAPGARGFPGLRSAIRHFLMELGWIALGHPPDSFSLLCMYRQLAAELIRPFVRTGKNGSFVETQATTGHPHTPRVLARTGPYPTGTPGPTTTLEVLWVVVPNDRISKVPGVPPDEAAGLYF